MTAGMFQIWSDDRLGERGNNESTTDRDDEGQPEKGVVTARLIDATEQESGQTQHPAANISSLAAMTSHSAQQQPNTETPPSHWINKDENFHFPTMCPRGQTCQICPNQTCYIRTMN